MPFKPFRGLVGLACFGLMAGMGLPAHAAAAELPALAQESVDKGLAADKRLDHLGAIAHFRKALEIAPDSPRLFFYLAVVEAKMPSRELRAICWYAAYLSSHPDAEKAAKVRQQIDRLRSAQHQTLLQVIKLAEDAAKASDGKFWWSSVAGSWASAGDFTSAMRLAGQIDQPPLKDQAYTSIALAQAEAGDLAAAKTTAALIKGAPERHFAQAQVVRCQVAAGDVKGARETWKAMDNLPGLVPQEAAGQSAASVIAEAQAKAGDRDGARETIAMALKNGEIIKEQQARDFFFSDIVGAQALCGDFAEARKTADLIQDVSFKAEALQGAAETQAKAGDASKALAMADLIIEVDKYGFHHRDGARRLIAVAQAARGDLAGSEKTLALIQNEFEKTSAAREIARLQKVKPSLGSGSAAADWLGYLDKSRPDDGPCALNLPVFLDLPAHLKHLQAADDPEKLVTDLVETANRMIGTQNAIDRQLQEIK